MALLTLNFESEFLKGNTEIHVIMPDREQELDAKNFIRAESCTRYSGFYMEVAGITQIGSEKLN